MTYQLQSLTPPQIARLDEVPIARQEQIIAQTGEPLRLVSSYYLVKNASADFTQPHETAQKLDAAMYELLAQKGFWEGNMQVVKPEVMASDKRLRLAQAKAKAQAARIRILKLKSPKAA